MKFLLRWTLPSKSSADPSWRRTIVAWPENSAFRPGATT